MPATPTDFDHSNEPHWRLYERAVAAFMAENEGIDVSPTPNAPIIGCITGIARQVDVLLDARWGDDLSRRMIVDAKYHGAKVDINDIESFEGMMKDCRAERGILVCPNGYTDGAKRRAQDAITIRVLTLDELRESTSWASFEECFGRCYTTKKVRSRVGLVLWGEPHALSINDMWTIVYTGKCDVCHNFQVWCWDCGDKFSLRDEDEYECSCGRIWVTAIEEEIDDPTGETLNAVHLFLCADGITVPLDRRMLR
jgi:Restriction endonuclease